MVFSASGSVALPAMPELSPNVFPFITLLLSSRSPREESAEGRKLSTLSFKRATGDLKLGQTRHVLQSAAVAGIISEPRGKQCAKLKEATAKLRDAIRKAYPVGSGRNARAIP